MGDALCRHWPEYMMEAAGLGLFMVAAGVSATLLESPQWGLRQAIPDPTLRRAREYVYHPRGADFSGSHLRLSSIYDWFQADFGGSEEFYGKISYDYAWRINKQ